MKRAAHVTPSAGYPGDLVEHVRALVAIAGALERGAKASVFDRVAAELSLDASVLRRRLAALARYAGAPLLGGRGSTLHLTATGRQVLGDGARLLELARAIGGPREDRSAPLRVACTGTILAEVLPVVLGSMRREDPEVRFRVRRAGAAAARELLANAELDLAVVRQIEAESGRGTVELERDLSIRARRVAEDRLWLAVPARSALAKLLERPRPPSLAQLATVPLVGYTATSATMKRVMSVLGPYGATPWIEVDRKEAALAYVAADLGIAFLSLVAGQRPARAGVKVRDVSALFPRMSFWLAWPTELPLVGRRAVLAERLTQALARPAARS